MTDRHSVLETSEAPGADRPAGRGITRPVLWILLVISAVCNIVTSVTDLGLVSNAFGLAVLACGAALVAHHYRHRRR